MSANPKPAGDPFLDQIDGIRAQLEMMRAEYLRKLEAQARDHAGLIDAARNIARADYMTNQEVANSLGLSLSAIQQGTGGTRCLFRARIKNGRKISHDSRRVRLHRQNILDRGECGDCDQADFGKYPRAIK